MNSIGSMLHPSSVMKDGSSSGNYSDIPVKISFTVTLTLLSLTNIFVMEFNETHSKVIWS